MHKRAELFLKDWALQHVGQGDSLQPQDDETQELVTRMLLAARDAGVPEAALREGTLLRSLIVGVRALANGEHLAVLPQISRRTS
ncbi:MAG: hypothetical protein AB7O49_09105 [Sphingomonadales bacterium]